MMREVTLETLPNVNIRDPSHDKKSSDYVCNWVDKPKCIQIIIMFMTIIHNLQHRSKHHISTTQIRQNIISVRPTATQISTISFSLVLNFTKL